VTNGRIEMEQWRTVEELGDKWQKSGWKRQKGLGCRRANYPFKKVFLFIEVYPYRSQIRLDMATLIW